MHPVLRNNLFFVKEHVGMFKVANNYDILDPNSHQIMMECRESNLGLLTRLMRLTDYKRMTPFHIEIKTPDGQKVLTVKRGVSIFLSDVTVFDENDCIVGVFKQELFSIGDKFDVFDAQGYPVFVLKGKWMSLGFRFMQGEKELAAVSKEWAGMGKELFTSADNYMLTISESIAAESSTRILLLAAVMCIDMVLKE